MSRSIGESASSRALHVDTAGAHRRRCVRLIAQALPSLDDNLYITSLMTPVSGIGAIRGLDRCAKESGIDNKPGDFEYVKIHE